MEQRVVDKETGEEYFRGAPFDCVAYIMEREGRDKGFYYHVETVPID